MRLTTEMMLRSSERKRATIQSRFRTGISPACSLARLGDLALEGRIVHRPLFTSPVFTAMPPVHYPHHRMCLDLRRRNLI